MDDIFIIETKLEKAKRDLAEQKRNVRDLKNRIRRCEKEMRAERRRRSSDNGTRLRVIRSVFLYLFSCGRK
jgi:predicted  nucleic acid-binding Zn-ribbon protein